MSTYRQLKQQIADLEKKAAIAMKEEVKKVIEGIRRQIAEFGLSAADLGLAVARKAGAKSPKTAKLVLKPKYRDPATGKTWNGHGKRPGWIVAAQNKGKLNELLIEKPARAKASAPTKAPAKPSAKKPQKKAVPAAKPAAGKATRKAAVPAPKKRALAPKAKVKKPAPRKASAPGPAPATAAMPEAAAIPP